MQKNILLILIFALFATNGQSNVLHWLTQIQGESGPVINNNSISVRISPNGRYVTFSSQASNLVNDDNNQLTDIFIHDLVAETTQLVTTTSNGQAIDGEIDGFSSVTSDGRYLAFASNAENLPNGIGSNINYVFLKDLQTGSISNLSGYGTEDFFRSRGAVVLSDDAQFLTFVSADNITPLHDGIYTQVYRKNLNNDSYELLSVSEDGSEAANDFTYIAAVSDDGRYVLMRSEATNLTTDVIKNNRYNLFLRDTLNDTTTLINTQPNGSASTVDTFTFAADVSNIGTVVFTTSQSDLVVNDNNQNDDVFYFNNGLIKRINLDLNGNEVTDSAAIDVRISGDGSRIVFVSNSGQLTNLDNDPSNFQLFNYDPLTETIEMITTTPQNEAVDGDSYIPVLPLNGSRMAFLNYSQNFSAAQTSDFHAEVFAYQFSNQLFKKVTVPAFNPNTILSDITTSAISSDQMTVAFSSKSPNVTDDEVDVTQSHVYILDRSNNQIQLLFNNAAVSDISASGRYLTITSNYAQPEADIDLGLTHSFLYDRLQQQVTLIEEGYTPRTNDDGNVVFLSFKGITNNDTNNTVDAYYYDHSNQSIDLISQTMGGAASEASYADIGGLGNQTHVVFQSDSALLVPADTNNSYDIFITKVSDGSISRVSQTAAGIEGNSISYLPRISNDGLWVTFLSYADNLTTDDYSQASDSQVFYYDRINKTVHLASINDAGLPVYATNDFDYDPQISDTGRYISYTFRDSGGLEGDDFSGDDERRPDAVLFDRINQTSQLVSLDNNQTNDDSTVGSTQVVENLDVNPPLIGVRFMARNAPALTGIANHPGFQELFLYQQGGPDVTLTVVVSGPGDVVGTSAISCVQNCQYNFELGNQLTLIANADNGMVFDRWEMDFGNCNDDSNPCDLIMDRSKTITAYFLDPSDVIFSDGFE